MEIAWLTPKGKITLPKEMRHDFNERTAFAVERKDDTIVLKKVDATEVAVRPSYVKKIRAIEAAGNFTHYDSLEALERELENA